MLTSSRTSGSANAAWWAVLIGAILAATVGYFRNPNLQRLAPILLDASATTGLLCAAGGAISSLIGILVAMMRVSRRAAVQFLAAGYVEVFRAIPLLVILLLVYFGINPLLKPAVTGLEIDLSLDRFWSAVAGIALCYGAYVGEAVRAGIEAIPIEEIEAASLEGNRVQVFYHVIIPQALRIIMPSWTNEMIALLKDTSLVYAVGLADITWRAREFGSSTGRLFEAYIAVAVTYLVLTLILSRISRWMERRWHAEMFLSGN